MNIKRAGSRPSGKGPADWFTGTVRIDPLFEAPDPARIGGAIVTFEPGARTAWHTHPLGQTLIVTAGCGWVGLALSRSLSWAAVPIGSHWRTRSGTTDVVSERGYEAVERVRLLTDSFGLTPRSNASAASK